MSSKRGIVISTPIIARKGLLQIDAVPLDAQQLRYWLLFWDKLNFPQLDALYIDTGNEGQFLETAGILERHQVNDVVINMSGDPTEDRPEEQFQHHFLRAFRELDAKEKGVWSIATGEQSISLDDDEFDEGRGVLFRLHHALPVPGEDVPLDDVLKFKEKRRDELLALRYHLDAAYLRITTSPDRSFSMNSELAAIELALINLSNSSKGSGIKKWVPASIDVELQIASGINAAVTAFQTGLPLLQTILQSAAISVSTARTLRKFRRDNPVPWRYVASYHEEIFHTPIVATAA